MNTTGVSQPDSAILKIARGERFLSAEIEHLLADDPPLPDLSPRQIEILGSIDRGKTCHLQALDGVCPR